MEIFHDGGSLARSFDHFEQAPIRQTITFEVNFFEFDTKGNLGRNDGEGVSFQVQHFQRVHVLDGGRKRTDGVVLGVDLGKTGQAQTSQIFGKFGQFIIGEIQDGQFAEAPLADWRKGLELIAAHVEGEQFRAFIDAGGNLAQTIGRNVEETELLQALDRGRNCGEAERGVGKRSGESGRGAGRGRRAERDGGACRVP